MANLNDLGRTTILNGNAFKLDGPELKVGDAAPNFNVTNSSLQSVDLGKTGPGIRIFSVVPSLDTPVCDAQTRRFEDEASSMPSVAIYTVSMDLPFAQTRWCGNYGVSKVVMLSDHRDGSFGEHYGTLVSDLRIESRAVFVVDSNDMLVHVEYVAKVGDHPNYEEALNAARAASETSHAAAAS